MTGGRKGPSRARNAVWVIAGCGVLTASTMSVAAPRWKLTGNPVPSASQVNAAGQQARKLAAEVGREQEQLAAANAKLTDLQTQAEILTERYDKTVVQEQQAAAGYRNALRQLAAARRAERESRQQVARLAANEYEAAGGVGAMAAMLGDANGPQAYLNQVAIGQVLDQRRTDILATNHADQIVATMFRAQARSELRAKQAAMRRADQLKTAVQAAVARQLSAVKSTRAQEAKLESSLASARSHAQSLASQRQAGLAAEAAARAAAQAAARAQAAQQAAANAASAGTSSGSASQAPSWAWGSSQAAGDVAANWALTQLGKPYLWGGAGPDAYDCSGLTMMAWAHAGVQLLHYTGYQWEEGTHVPLSQLQRGDLLFYATDNSDPATIHHVGIYIGNGDMVDAPYTGAFVRIDSIYQPGVPIGAVRP